MTASTPDQEAVAIAAELKKGQRDMIVNEPSNLPQHLAIMLIDKGLVHWFVPRGRKTYAFTPLGLRVRAVLLDMARS